MKKGTFEGTSTNGSFEEAIAKAIILAKSKLKVDFIIWNLNSLFGANGGLVYSNIVTVSIKVKGVNVKKNKEKEENSKKINPKTIKPISETEKSKIVNKKAVKQKSTK